MQATAAAMSSQRQSAFGCSIYSTHGTSQEKRETADRNKKSAYFDESKRSVGGGVRGIRTPDTLLAYTRFPGVPLQPLEHHSFADKLCKNTTIIFFAQRFLPIFRQRRCDGCILSFYEAGKAGGHRELEIHLLSGDWMHKS